MQACVGDRTARKHAPQEYAAWPRQPQGRGDVGRYRLAFAAEPGKLDAAATLPAFDAPPHEIGRDRKSDAAILAGARNNSGVDSRQPPIRRDQGASRVAGIDRGVRLNEELIFARAA